jgi:hypothetical protein
MSEAIVCNGCGATLPIPASAAAGDGWLILESTRDGHTMTLHWCGQCRPASLYEALETYSPGAP